MSKLSPSSSSRVALAPTEVGGDAALDELRAARRGRAALENLTPEAYARGHAVFEGRSDQRTLIGDYLAARLALRGSGPVSVLSVGCGDGTLDAPLAAALADVAPAREVRYVGVDPYVGSTNAFAAAMADLGRANLESEVQTATFAEAAVSGPFDVVTFVHSMYYVPEAARAIRAAYELLAPGGELLVLSAPRGALNMLVDVLAPPVEGHEQWFSEDIAVGVVEAGLATEDTFSIEALLDLDSASDEVLDFTVQAQLTAELRPLVRDYLDVVSVPHPTSGVPHVPHPVDVYRVRRPD